MFCVFRIPIIIESDKLCICTYLRVRFVVLSILFLIPSLNTFIVYVYEKNCRKHQFPCHCNINISINYNFYQMTLRANKVFHCLSLYLEYDFFSFFSIFVVFYSPSLNSHLKNGDSIFNWTLGSSIIWLLRCSQCDLSTWMFIRCCLRIQLVWKSAEHMIWTYICVCIWERYHLQI